nr:NADH dehydrogenase subunit 5 [Nelidina sp. n.]
MVKNKLYMICSLLMLIFSLVFLFLGLLFSLKNLVYMFEWLIFTLNSVNIIYVIYLDWISLMFSFVVFLISGVVIMYSMFYMGSLNYSCLRFLFLVILFVMSMLLMILSPNMISILLGWDGLGLISYCLVIYYSSLSSYYAGLITCLINRLGDIGLLISISWTFSYGSWMFMFYSYYYNNLIMIFVVLSSFTKSAQIPFSSWLPSAMAAPTPVSSLVHSSTLVTAGVYLLIRFFSFEIFKNNYFLFISVLTMVVSSLCANYEYDLKKIIAFSTLSQLGLMMSCLFLSLKDLTYFHLLTHAMFKSLLFLCSGIFIHLMGGCQDIRMMGSICLMMPFTSCCMNISNMALFGFPFLSGFYSKDLIVEMSVFMGMNFYIFIMFYLGLSLTCLYSIRLFYYTMMNKFNYLNFFSMMESMNLMNYSIIILTFFSLNFGCFFMWLMSMNLEFLVMSFYMKLLTLFMLFIGLYLGYEFVLYKNFMLYLSSYFMGSMWFMYSYSYSVFNLSFYMSKNLFFGSMWGEYYGGMGLSFYLMKLSNFIQFYSLGGLSMFYMTIIFWLMFMI